MTSFDDSRAMLCPSGDTKGACVPAIVVRRRFREPSGCMRQTCRSEGFGSELTHVMLRVPACAMAAPETSCGPVVSARSTVSPGVSRYTR